MEERNELLSNLQNMETIDALRNELDEVSNKLTSTFDEGATVRESIQDISSNLQNAKIIETDLTAFLVQKEKDEKSQKYNFLKQSR